MCEPTSIALIGLAVVGTAVTVVGQQQAARAQQKASDFNAAVARNNSIIAERQAKDAIARGEVEASLAQRQAKQLAARQRVAFAANGVVVDEGTALDIVGDTAELGKFDELRARNNAAREALGFRTQGMNFDAEAELSEFQGQQARTSANFATAGSIISGASTVASRWQQFNQTTSFNRGLASANARFDVIANPATRNFF